jgi:DNA modification methylase
VSLAQVLQLVDLDAFGETFVPRSGIPTYLLDTARTPVPKPGALDTSCPVSLFAGDAHELIRRVPAGSVQCVVTSPPYWAQRLYDTHVAVAWADGETAAYGQEQTPEGYIRHTVELLYLLRRTLTSSASVWWNLMDTYNTRTAIRSNAAETLNAMNGTDNRGWHDHAARRYSSGHSFLKDGDQCHIPGRVAERASRLGYWTRSVITWRKTGFMPESVGSRVSRALEYNIHFSVDRSPLFHKDAWNHIPVELGGRSERYESSEALTDVWTLPTSTGRGGHGAQFPLALPGRCIALSTEKEDLVLDPFAGLANACIAAYRLSRRSIGFDISENYLALARERLSALGVAA